MLDNTWFALVFEPQQDSKDREYSLIITSGSSPGSGITAYSSVDDSILEGSLEVNGVPQTGDLSLIVYYMKAP
jgi:hypothetical protein